MTTAPPISPNSSPMIAKMKSLQAFGRNRPPASRLSPSPAPRIPPSPSASSPGSCGSRPERVGPRVEPGLDPLDLVAAQAGHDDRQGPRRCPSPARWRTFAPATKNIVNAVSPRTDRRPEVGLAEDERDDRGDDHEERDRARPEAAILVPRFGEPVGEVDDHRELRDLGRVDGRQRADLEPARRAADDDVQARDEDEGEEPSADDRTAPRSSRR